MNYKNPNSTGEIEGKKSDFHGDSEEFNKKSPIELLFNKIEMQTSFRRDVGSRMWHCKTF